MLWHILSFFHIVWLWNVKTENSPVKKEVQTFVNFNIGSYIRVHTLINYFIFVRHYKFKENEYIVCIIWLAQTWVINTLILYHLNRIIKFSMYNYFLWYYCKVLCQLSMNFSNATNVETCFQNCNNLCGVAI